MNIKMNTEEIEAEVDLLIPAYTCKYIRETAQGTWECDQWEFKINSVKFDFYTGLGHRGITEKAARVPEPPHVPLTEIIDQYYTFWTKLLGDAP